MICACWKENHNQNVLSTLEENAKENHDLKRKNSEEAEEKQRIVNDGAYQLEIMRLVIEAD